MAYPPKGVMLNNGKSIKLQTIQVKMKSLLSVWTSQHLSQAGESKVIHICPLSHLLILFTPLVIQ